MTRSLLIAAAILIATGCSKKHDDARTHKLATLCVTAGDALARDAATADTDSFESLLSSALEACSQACDGDDQPSCEHLHSHLAKVCHASSSVCESLCSSAHSPSLKQTACKLAPKKS